MLLLSLLNGLKKKGNFMNGSLSLLMLIIVVAVIVVIAIREIRKDHIEGFDMWDKDKDR